MTVEKVEMDEESQLLLHICWQVVNCSLAESRLVKKMNRFKNYTRTILERAWYVWAMPFGRCRLGDAVWALPFGRRGVGRLGDEILGRLGAAVWATKY